MLHEGVDQDHVLPRCLDALPILPCSICRRRPAICSPGSALAVTRKPMPGRQALLVLVHLVVSTSKTCTASPGPPAPTTSSALRFLTRVGILGMTLAEVPLLLTE
jgi:hypothetical protein